jgi:uncharacterized protein YegP (UPF0339 family)
MKNLRTTTIPALLVLALTSALAVGCATVEEGDADSSTTTAEVAVRPSFDLWKDAGGKWRFELIASNGEGLLNSQGYSSRTAALGGLLSVLDNGQYTALYEVKTAVSGETYFNLLAANRSVIGTSEMYASDANARAGVQATINAVDAYLEHWDTATGARYDVFQGADGQFYFDVRARNGAIVLTSQGYTTHASALNGAFSVAENGVQVTRYRTLQGVDGRWYFNLTATNGQVIATSQMYSSKYNAERARNSLIALLPTIELL